jgi:hypothetical protein
MAHENNKVCEPQDPLRLDIKDMTNLEEIKRKGNIYVIAVSRFLSFY